MYSHIGDKSCSILIFLLVSLCGGCNNSSSGGASILVTVTDQAGNQLPSATVVLGDSNGAMKAHGTTDANGQITFNDAPSNATITVGFICLISELTYTAYSFDIEYDVNAPVNLKLWSCSAPSSAATVTTLGTAIVNVTNAMTDIAQNTIQTNQLLFFNQAPLITQQTLTITSLDLQKDGKLSIIVTGKDANGSSIAYGALLDQAFTDGMTANITVDQPMSSVQYQVLNIPASGGDLCHYLSQSRTGKGSIFIDDCLSLSSAPTSTILNMPYIPGLGDQFYYGVSIHAWSDNGDGSSIYSGQYLSISGPTSSISPSNQIMDLSQALTAPSNLTVSAANTVTPTLSWSGVDLRATTYGIYANFRPTSARFIDFRIDNLSPTRSSITFPELPDSLAAFRPTGVYGFSVFTSADFGSYRVTSSGGYKKFLP